MGEANLYNEVGLVTDLDEVHLYQTAKPEDVEREWIGWNVGLGKFWRSVVCSPLWYLRRRHILGSIFRRVPKVNDVVLRPKTRPLTALEEMDGLAQVQGFLRLPVVETLLVHAP